MSARPPSSATPWRASAVGDAGPVRMHQHAAGVEEHGVDARRRAGRGSVASDRGRACVIVRHPSTPGRNRARVAVARALSRWRSATIGWIATRAAPGRSPARRRDAPASSTRADRQHHRVVAFELEEQRLAPAADARPPPPGRPRRRSRSSAPRGRAPCRAPSRRRRRAPCAARTRACAATPCRRARRRGRSAASSVASTAKPADSVLIIRSRKTFSRTCCAIVFGLSIGRFGSRPRTAACAGPSIAAASPSVCT